MKVALAQIETRAGQVAWNEARIVSSARDALALGAELVLFPELSVTGYPPKDLLFREDFVREAARATARIARAVPGIEIVLGTVLPGERKLRNVAALLSEGRVSTSRAKTLLPSYGPFLEERWFEPGEENTPLAGVGVLICEDLWDERYPQKPARSLKEKGARFLLVLNASPYREGIARERLARARRAGLPLAYVNQVGAEDELVFDGGSFAVSGSGKLLASLPRFQEALEVVDLEAPGPALEPVPEDRDEATRRALVLGIRAFAQRNGALRAVLGLSGGVDSALTASLAKDALGGENVHAIAIPSRFSDPRSLESAREIARSLGLSFETVSLEPMLQAAEGALGLKEGTPHENLQARLRMTILMADVNRKGGLLLGTSNKTELALGYGTLFGDLAGDLLPLGDLAKDRVYALARLYAKAIPRFVLERKPTAELAPSQEDPFDYETVAPLASRLLRGERPEKPCPLEARVRAAEHKRRLAPIVLRVTEDAIGPGRLLPVAGACFGYASRAAPLPGAGP